MWDIENTGIDRDALEKLIEEQIYTLPGTDRHREELSILLTGSRAFGTHVPSSDIDIDILCPRDVYVRVHQASMEAGIIQSPTSFLHIVSDEVWRRYGSDTGHAHFSLMPLDDVERQFDEYDDVALWVWTNARIITDPDGRFQRIRDGFHGYPKDVLIQKLKYRWMLAWYWAIDVYPHNHNSDDELLPAAIALLNSVNELLKFFFLAEGKPFPYTEKLMPFSGTTKLGREFGTMLRHVVDIVIGKSDAVLSPWERLDLAFRKLACSGAPEGPDPLEEAGYAVMLAAGVDPKWVEADFNNINELLSGSLGPPP